MTHKNKKFRVDAAHFGSRCGTMNTDTGCLHQFKRTCKNDKNKAPVSDLVVVDLKHIAHGIQLTELKNNPCNA